MANNVYFGVVKGYIQAKFGEQTLEPILSFGHMVVTPKFWVIEKRLDMCKMMTTYKIRLILVLGCIALQRHRSKYYTLGLGYFDFIEPSQWETKSI